jgi:hypothetical protein
VWHRSVRGSLSSSPNQICPSSMDPSAGPLAMSRYAMALLMPKSSPAVALRLGAICVVVAKLLEEVALNAKAARSSREHRHTFACSLLTRFVLALPNMSSEPASSSSFQLTASDRLSPCFAATGESVSCSFATSSTTFILNCGL